jgi:hypothetical protein
MDFTSPYNHPSGLRPATTLDRIAKPGLGLDSTSIWYSYSDIFSSYNISEVTSSLPQMIGAQKVSGVHGSAGRDANEGEGKLMQGLNFTTFPELLSRSRNG